MRTRRIGCDVENKFLRNGAEFSTRDVSIVQVPPIPFSRPRKDKSRLKYRNLVITLIYIRFQELRFWSLHPLSPSIRPTTSFQIVRAPISMKGAASRSSSAFVNN